MENFIEIAGDVLFDAAKDTLYLIPFLFITYLLMEWLEHKASSASEKMIKKAGFAGPLIGSFLGVLPQCGFSSAASTLYAGRVITLGTLIAVYLSTSDEMLPVFIANGVPARTIAVILATKVLIGIIMGVLLDLAVRLSRRPREALRIHEICERDDCHCNGECEVCQVHPEYAYDFEEDAHHHHNHSGTSFLKSALGHTIRVTIFIFLITLVLNTVIFVIGEEGLKNLVVNNTAQSIIISALVGLIPNCAASVCIAELYVQGTLGSAAMMSGLLVSAGVGLLLLLRTNRPVSRSLAIIVILLAIGMSCGFIIDVMGISF